LFLTVKNGLRNATDGRKSYRQAELASGFETFSSESLLRTRSAMDAGSRQENASEQESRAPVLIQSEAVI
jgi:hypothetical protein